MTVHESRSRLPLQRVRDRSVDPVSAVCHDLRQPLAAILMLADAPCNDPGPRLEAIATQARWLADLVDDVLKDASVDDGGWVDVAECAHEAVGRAQVSAACSIELESRGAASTWARPVALTRAIGCLLDNAVRAAGPDGSVTVEVLGPYAMVGQPGDVTITITDDGPGLGHVASRTSLGLSITRALVASCGGSFDLSAGAAGGAVARISLPGLRNQA